MGKSRGKSRRRKGKGRSVFMLFFVLAILIGGSALYLTGSKSPPEPGNEDKMIVNIPLGSGTQTIGDLLKEKGVIKSSFVFRVESKLKGYDGLYKAGEYLFSPSMDMNSIIDSLINGDKRNVVRFTIPEGYTVDQTIDAILAKGLGTEEGLKKEAAKGKFPYDFLKDAPKETVYALEGYLYPQTYDVSPGASDRSILNTMLNHFGTLFTEEMALKAKQSGYDINEIITIASLIERETSVKEEKGKIASVIYNRLKLGMPLQIDATIQYALGKPKASLSINDTKIDSPYNTYKLKGLPPGPICSPAIDSIGAALNPDTTDYIYYVLGTDGTGAHKFSKDYSKFLIDKAAYKKYLKSKQ